MAKKREEDRAANRPVGGIEDFMNELSVAMMPAQWEATSAMFSAAAPVFKELDSKRNDPTLSDEIRAEYEDLGAGYVGDPLMEINIALYDLANALPASIWKQYGKRGDEKKLLKRINANLAEAKTMKEADRLPSDFLVRWKEFMELYGDDGQDQLFLSCPRYRDSPELLLGKLRLNSFEGIKDPRAIQTEQVKRRRQAMAKQEERTVGECCDPFALSRIQKRNAIIENLLWIRNAPKIRLALMIGMIRWDLLKLENKLIEEGRLKEKGDIFHLSLQEVDKATLTNDLSADDLAEIIGPRKAVYERALRQPVCPLLVDSRCRILQPDPPQHVEGEELEEGTLIGAAISPGITTGRVRIVHDPDGKFEQGEVLCAVVTGPAWTPLFASASAVVLQMGGALQHGALCAREYGKPAVSNINVLKVLKDGMMVSVDGNTGVVKILEE